MKTTHMGSPNNFNEQSNSKPMSHSEILSNQIENLRVVLRRMKVNDSSKVDSLINQKLKELQ